MSDIALDSLISINGENVQTLEVLFLTTLISLLPSLVVMMTSFTRYIISLSFLRNALGTQQTPPNMVLTGMALFLTLFTMSSTLDQIKAEAYDPYVAGTISQEEFVDRAEVPLKDFMTERTKIRTLQMFCDLGGVDMPETVTVESLRVLPLRIIVPAFMTCELQRGFEIGFLLYIPFMLVDVVVATTLMSMGMVMLPPSMISAPFKLLLFVTVNGWEMVFSSLVRGFL